MNTVFRAAQAALLTLAIGSTAAFAAPAVPAAPTVKHQGLDCTVCHADGKLTPPDMKTCLACHPTDVIVKATERFNFESYFKDPRDGKETRKPVAINPHDNFHYGKTDQCVNCHKEHKPSTVTCEKCHDIGPWKMKLPR